MSPRTRRAAGRALVCAASVAVVLAVLVAYADRAAFNSNQFANRATAALQDDSVRSLVAERITDELVLKNQADLLAARPLIESIASAIVGGRAFTDLFRAGVRDVHRAVFQRDRDTVTLTVADIGTVMAAALRKLQPSLAREVEAIDRVQLVKRDMGSATAGLAQTAEQVRWLSIILAALALALVAGALVLSPDRRGTAGELGIGVAAASVVLLVAYGVLRSVVIHRAAGPDAEAAAGAVWDAFLRDLRTGLWVLAACGATVAAAAASLLKPVDISVPLRRTAAWIATEPSRTPLRVLRALALVAAGVLVILEQSAVVQLVVTVAGVFLVYAGVTSIMRMVYRPGAEAPADVVRTRARARRAGAHRAAVPVLAAALIALAVGTFLANGGTSTAAPATGACNGHRELCGRSLDRVALAATHNAMSVPLPGWYSAEQDKPIAAQLAGGVRGLLLDTHYADRLSNGKLRTYFGSRDELHRQAKQDGISEEAVDAALRIRERLGFSGEGERGMYLCHTFCELGATRLESVLDDIHDFLITNPGEVLVVINQDYVTPKDFVAAADDAGLGELVYRGPVTGELPTLRQMIDSGQRVVFLAENHAGEAPWYRLAYGQMTEETPYTFPKAQLLTDPDELAKSCAPNRGPKGAPMFLMNHWVSTDPAPRPSDAAKVNAYEPLLQRARECGQLRGHLTNLVAVNFYLQGDVFRVVDALNGVR